MRVESRIYETRNYSSGKGATGLLDLLCLPQPVDWNPGRFFEPALVRSLNRIIVK